MWFDRWGGGPLVAGGWRWGLGRWGRWVGCGCGPLPGVCWEGFVLFRLDGHPRIHANRVDYGHGA